VLPDGQVPVLLPGDPPDAARVPSGCRFHPRCPLLAASTDPELALRCRSVPLPVISGDAGSAVACHATGR